MQLRTKLFFAGLILVVCVGALLISRSRDPRLERLIGWRLYPAKVREAAIEPEVVRAELEEYGTQLLPALQKEVHAGALWRSKPARWVEGTGPKFLSNWMARQRASYDRRREAAVLCLGRLGSTASSAAPELHRIAAAGGSLGLTAEVALAMIEKQNPTIQSKAIAALTSGSQPRRFHFLLYAEEIWPGRSDLIEPSLTDENASVRASAADFVGRAGSRASNAVPALLTLLSDKSAVVRPRAALALGLVASNYADTAVVSILDQQKTNFTWTGHLSYQLFQALGPAANKAIPAIEADLANSKMTMCHGDAAAALWRVTGKMSPEIVAGLNRGLKISVQHAQVRCLRIIKEIGPEAAGTAPELERLKNHPLVLIRKLAAEALESVRPTSNPAY
jgi:hypothetical protein